MNLSTRGTAISTAAVMASALALASTPANAAPSASQVQAVVSGTLDGRAFTEQMSNLRASVVNGTATLSGSLTGTGLPAVTPFTATIGSITALPDPGAMPAMPAMPAIPTIVLAPKSVPAPDPAPDPAPVPVTAPAPAPALDCTLLTLVISDLRLNLLGVVILIPNLQLIAGGVTGSNAVLGNVLCQLVAAANPPAPPTHAAVSPLN